MQRNSLALKPIHNDSQRSYSTQFPLRTYLRYVRASAACVLPLRACFRYIPASATCLPPLRTCLRCVSASAACLPPLRTYLRYVRASATCVPPLPARLRCVRISATYVFFTCVLSYVYIPLYTCFSAYISPYNEGSGAGLAGGVEVLGGRLSGRRARRGSLGIGMIEDLRQ